MHFGTRKINVLIRQFRTFTNASGSWNHFRSPKRGFCCVLLFIHLIPVLAHIDLMLWFIFYWQENNNEFVYLPEVMLNLNDQGQILDETLVLQIWHEFRSHRLVPGGPHIYQEVHVMHEVPDPLEPLPQVPSSSATISVSGTSEPTPVSKPSWRVIYITKMFIWKLWM